jgi:hypothetical protein
MRLKLKLNLLPFVVAMLLSSCHLSYVPAPVHEPDDHTGPSVIITGLSHGQTISGPVTFGYVASDMESTVGQVTVTVNGQQVKSTLYESFTVTDSAGFSPSTPGDFTITILASSAGGDGSTSIVVHYPGP